MPRFEIQYMVIAQVELTDKAIAPYQSPTSAATEITRRMVESGTSYNYHGEGVDLSIQTVSSGIKAIPPDPMDEMKKQMLAAAAARNQETGNLTSAGPALQ